MTPTAKTRVFTPAQFGLPSKFKSFRTGQFSAAETIAESDVRFVAGAYPTGSGKSLVAATSHRLYGGRGVILTSTKLLSEQYQTEFGMTEMRGQSNFSCPHVSFGPRTCADGKAILCPDRSNGTCEYIQAQQRFLESEISVTNYDYYLSSMIHGEGCGEIDFLILDEAHTAVQQLSDALTITVEHNKLEYFYNITGHPPFDSTNPTNWKEWSRHASERLVETKRRTPELLQRTIPHYEAFQHLLSRLPIVKSDWIVENNSGGKPITLISPLWPTDYAKKYLFGNASKVLLVSATIVPKTLSLLGIKEEESLFLSSAYQFPVERGPVYLMGVHRIDMKTNEWAWNETLGRMDSVINRRLDRKGLIHSVSYDRQRFIKSRSVFAEHMMAPEAGALREAVIEFRKADPPKILVSPAITTGYDFPGKEAEYQFIMKLPFIDQRGEVMKARIKQDPEYGHYLTAQTFTQMCGRTMRSSEDQSETFVMDKHANWFFMPKDKKGFRHLFPNWFIPLVRWQKESIPMPPPALEEF